ncbi:MAG: AAA family ATPase [Jatrophihabitans sp.]
MSLIVATAADGAAWEAALLAELNSAPSPLTVSRRCVDVVELLAVAASGQAIVALVDDRLRRLDADAVERLATAGVATVGVTAPGSPADSERLASIGISFSVPADASAAVFCTVLEAALADVASIDPTSARAFSDPARPAASPTDPLMTDRLAEPPVRRGSIVAVWGPAGAPGRTLVAANVADELARLGPSALLIDADVYGGVAASVFGLLDESPGLVAACRQAQSRRLDVEGLAALCWQISGTLRVLTGIARADRWPELRPSAMEQVLAVSRQLVDFTVLDLGFSLETDEELSFDTIAPRRNGATLAALDAADLVLVVGSADPIGMQRLVRGLDGLRSAEIDKPVWVVLNRVRGGAVPGVPEVELNAALKRFAGRAPAALLPYDLQATDQAGVVGKTLAEAAPNSPLRRAMAELAMAISGAEPPQRGRRRGSTAGRRRGSVARQRERPR